jgi:hypothetical protein
MGEDLVEKQP